MQDSDSQDGSDSAGIDSDSARREEMKQLAALDLPSTGETRQALLEWAFYEATQLARQYADVVEDVRSFIETGTTSVGECVLLVDSELTGSNI